jgi:multiple sugar transport system substrate-binding protein
MVAAAVLVLSLASLAGTVAALAAPGHAIGTTVRFYTWDNRTEWPFFNAIFTAMHRSYPHIQVQTEPSASISQVQMVTRIAAGSAADVIQVGDTDLPWYVARNAFRPLDAYLQRDNVTRDLWFSETYNLGVVAGHTYALTKDYATLAVFYNKDLFDRAHLPYPQAGWTWHDLLHDAQALTITRGGRRVQWGLRLPGAWARGVEPLVRDYGGQLVSPDGKTIRGYMNSRQTIAATQFYVDLVNRYHVALSPAEQAAFANVDPFASGRVAMYWTGPWQITTWQQTRNLHFAVAPMPSYGGNAYTNICWAGFAMNAHTKNPEAAWQVIKALSGPDGSAVFARWALPAVKSVAARMQSIDPASYPYRSVFLSQVTNVPALPADMRNPDGHASVETPYENALSLLWAHPRLSVKAALDGAAARGQQELDAYHTK